MKNPLSICVLGRTMRDATNLLWDLVVENIGQMKELSLSQSACELKDGTRLKAVPVTHVTTGWLEGIRFDQIIADLGFCENVPLPQLAEALAVLNSMCEKSAVPKEFRWQIVKEERGDHHD